jgi:hypothetical protein
MKAGNKRQEKIEKKRVKRNKRLNAKWETQTLSCLPPIPIRNYPALPFRP